MPGEIDHIAELQKKLYTRDPANMPQRKFGILHPIKEKTTSTWGTTELPDEKYKKPGGVSGYKKFFFFTLIFFVIGLGAALFSVYRGALTLSSKNVDLTILGNAFVGGGEILPIQVEVVNKNSADLVDAVLTINYPKGATDETGSDVVRIERPLGTIGSGKTTTEAFSVILYGEQGINRQITATLTYKLQGTLTTFQKENSFSVVISSSPIGLTVDAPSSIVSNQPFTITIRNTFSGDTLLNNVVTRVEYPNGFVFQSASPEPVSGTNVWTLGDLEKGAERTITIEGRLVGEERDEKAFRVYVGTPESDMSSKIAVTYSSVLATTVIAQPFIAGQIEIDGNATDDVVSVPIGSSVSGAISWVNNSPLTITNPIFTLVVDGTAVNQSSISAEHSYYDPGTHAIAWTADSYVDLISIAPGASGRLPFHFSTITAPTGLKDVNLSLSVAGTFPDRENTQQIIDNIDQMTVRFSSNLQFAATALHSIGAIKNTGPYPPKADTETTYTINWTIKPTENPLSRVTASASIPAGAVWTGVIVPATEDIQYNPDSRIVTWNIGSMPRATATVRSKSVSFQVKVKPTKSQIGNEPLLLGETSISAIDAVTNTTISSTRPQLTTTLATDPAYTTGLERVVP